MEHAGIGLTAVYLGGEQGYVGFTEELSGVNAHGRALMAAVLEYFACYLKTGSTQAAHRAVLLLERLALDPDANESIREHGLELAETIKTALVARS